nr:F-box only protein 8-like [Ipomoea batatas]
MISIYALPLGLGLGFEIQLSPSPPCSSVSAFADISAPSRLKKMDCASKKLKKMDDATSIASLPQEIILKILTTLPPKSAVSFRCTSKFFHSFIPQPHFAFRILFWVSSTNLNTVGYTTEETHGRLQPSSLQCSADELQRFKRLRLGGSSFADGKLCLFSRGGEITILDLSTRQYISLPRTFVEPEPGCRDRWTKMNSGAALGFDPVSKRYKVLKSELYGNITHQYRQGMLRVLTLGVDESWRVVTTEKSFIPAKPYASVQIDGFIYLIHFKINCRNEHEIIVFDKEIVVFDIEMENLIGVIPFPYIFQHSGAYHSSWVKLNDRLAFIYVDVKRTRIFVCTLEKSMGPEWDKHEVLLTLEEAKIISQAESMSFTANSIGEIVFLIRAAGSIPLTILIYACRTQLWRKFEITGYSRFENLRRMIVHVIEEKVYFSE